MNLESLSLKELKDKANEQGVLNYHNLSKPKLIKILNAKTTEVELPEEEVIEISSPVEQPIEPTIVADSKPVSAKLSLQAQKWQEYLRKINSTPSAFLLRYPNHKYKIFIEEVLINENR